MTRLPQRRKESYFAVLIHPKNHREPQQVLGAIHYILIVRIPMSAEPVDTKATWPHHPSLQDLLVDSANTGTSPPNLWRLYSICMSKVLVWSSHVIPTSYWLLSLFWSLASLLCQGPVIRMYSEGLEADTWCPRGRFLCRNSIMTKRSIPPMPLITSTSVEAMNSLWNSSSGCEKHQECV